MAVTEKSTVKAEAVFSEDKKHRFLLRKEWNKNKKSAAVIMISPSTADQLKIDYTTLYIMNNLVGLDYGSVDIVNLFSKIDIKTSLKENHEELIHEENDSYILKAATRADTIIIAWGKTGNSSKKLQKRKLEAIQMLEKFKDKLYQINDNNGGGGYHPLAPQVRFQWNLEPFVIGG